MKIDCHLHTHTDSKYTCGNTFDTDAFLSDINAAGFDGAALYTLNPNRYPNMTPEERMDYTLNICKGKDTLFPFYWINPLEDDALEQIDLAIEKGFVAFKMICRDYLPGCNKSMDVLERIAQRGKSVLFHTGICWDGVNSANNHKPANFEALIEIPRLKFCLAHISWPWYDECIAVYGKFNNAYSVRPDTSCEMFIDVTPGTPRVYREEVFRHLLCSDYELRYNLMFGTDSSTSQYNVSWSKEWQQRDNALYEKFIPNDVEDFKDHVYGKNFLRFIGKSDEVVNKVIPLVGQ